MKKHIELELSWPKHELSPNAKPHFYLKNRVFQKYRSEAFWQVKAAYGRTARPTAKRGKYPMIELQYVWYPPDRRRRDEDNFFASMKAAQDGIAAALEVDDCFFHLKEIVHKDPAKPGKVICHVYWTE